MKREIKFKVWDNQLKKIILDNPFLGFSNPEYSFMQYTGVKDVNGKEVYEGDILKEITDEEYGNHFGENCKFTWIEFYKGAFHMVIHYDMAQIPLYDSVMIYDPTKYPENQDKYNWLKHYEVVGNIFENLTLIAQSN